MSEYWKSVPRKFCDFCKCWITDNKPSVEFHERGKRHQENVELRLKEVRKKSLKNSREEETMKEEMEKMEKAALEAFKKDLKDNPELAAKYGVSLEPKPDSNKDGDSSSSAATPSEKKKKRKVEESEWYEAVTPEGYHYYWSSVTGESRWEAPDEFVSVAEQEAETNGDSSDKEAATRSVNTDTDRDTTKPESTEKAQDAPSSATDDTVSSVADNSKLATRVDPSHSRSVYGAWDVVKEVERPPLYNEDSAPPELDDIPLPVQDSGKDNPKPQKPKFKEKTVTSLGPSTGGAVTFKKRKIASGARNVRQKNEDD